MEKRIISQKIDSLINCLSRIKSKEPFVENALKSDFDIQDIVSVNLERSIQNCIDIASHVATDFDDIHGLSSASLFLELGNRKIISQETAENLSRAVGFRNLLVHRYANIDWDKVQSGLTQNLEQLKIFIKEVTDYCKL